MLRGELVLPDHEIGVRAQRAVDLRAVALALVSLHGIERGVTRDVVLARDERRKSFPQRRQRVGAVHGRQHLVEHVGHGLERIALLLAIGEDRAESVPSPIAVRSSSTVAMTSTFAPAGSGSSGRSRDSRASTARVARRPSGRPWVTSLR
jgi:hypothetical protein